MINKASFMSKLIFWDFIFKYRSSPPSVYYKGTSDQFVKRVADYEYKGNHLDVVHLTKHRIGATPNIGQVTFETGLRKYMS